MKRTLGIDTGASSPVSHRWQDLVHSNDPAAARAFGGESPRRVPAIETDLAMARESGEQPRAQPSTAAELAGAREVSMATGVLIERAYLDRVNVLGLLRRHDRYQRPKLRDVTTGGVTPAETLNLSGSRIVLGTIAALIRSRRVFRETMMALRTTLSCLALSCALGFGACAEAQSYPSRTVRLIAPYVAGGGTDFVSRTVATKLSEMWGSAVVVENRPGGGTNIGSELVARASPDGYTLLVGGTPNTVNPSLYRKLPYDTLKDFSMVILLDTAPNVLAVHPSLPAKSVKELVALAKKNPGALNFGSAGIGSSNHLSGELFKSMAAIDIVHIAYKGGAAAVTDLLGGQITMYFGTTPSTMPLVRAGRLRGLAVTTARRTSAAPDLPTMSEAALPGFEQYAWHGIFAPAGTPAAVVARLNADLNVLLKSNDVLQKFASQGIEVEGGTPEDFAAFVRRDMAKYQKLVQSAGIRID